jgi:hypothetical protein
MCCASDCVSAMNLSLPEKNGVPPSGNSDMQSITAETRAEPGEVFPLSITHEDA